MLAPPSPSRPIPVSYILDETGSNLSRLSDETYLEEKWKQLAPGINIFETDIGGSPYYLKILGQKILSDTGSIDREILASLIPEENKLYFIRLVGQKPFKVMCVINYNPKPKFRSYRKKLGKTKRSKSRSKRSKSIH